MDFSMELICTGRGIAKRYKQMLVEIADDCHLTAAELSVLLFLQNEDKDTAREIAEGRHMSKASVSKAVDLLYHKNYISGHPDRSDRRVVHLMIEDGAQEVLNIACERQLKMMECLFQDISEEEMRSLICVARKICRNLSTKGR